MSLFSACEADHGWRAGGVRSFVKCGDIATVTIRDGARTISLCTLCAAWLTTVYPDVEQTPIGGDAA